LWLFPESVFCTIVICALMKFFLVLYGVTNPNLFYIVVVVFLWWLSPVLAWPKTSWLQWVELVSRWYPLWMNISFWNCVFYKGNIPVLFQWDFHLRQQVNILLEKRRSWSIQHLLPNCRLCTQLYLFAVFVVVSIIIFLFFPLNVKIWSD